MNPTSTKVMDYVARKARKIQGLRGIDRSPSPAALGDLDMAYLQRVLSAGNQAPPLPRRPMGNTAGDYEDSILQLVLYDSANAQENLERGINEDAPESKKARKKREKDDKERERERGRMTKEELTELEKLVDNVKEKTRERSHDKRGDGEQGDPLDSAKNGTKSPESKAGRFASLLHMRSKKEEEKPPSRPRSPNEEEIDREAEELSKVLDDIDLSSASKGPLSFTKNSADLLQEFNYILKDLMNGVPTAYDDLTTLLDDKDNSMNRTYKKLPPFVQKLIAGVPKKVEARAMGVVNQTQTAVGAKPTEAGSSVMTIAQSFLGVATLKELVTNPAGVKGALVTIMNALKLRFPAFLGTNVLMSLGVFILLFSFWYCHKRGREVRLAGDSAKALTDANGTVLAIEGPLDDTSPKRAGKTRTRRDSFDSSLTDRSYMSRGSHDARSDESREERRRARHRRERREAERREDDRRAEARADARGKKSPRHGSDDDRSVTVRDADSVVSKEHDRERRHRPREDRERDRARDGDRDRAGSELSETDSEEERERRRRRARRRERRRRERERDEEEAQLHGGSSVSGSVSGSVRDREGDIDRERERRREREADRESERSRRGDHGKEHGHENDHDHERRKDKERKR